MVLLNVWNGPYWLGCSRAKKPRRRASSAALVDERGSDDPCVDCTLRLPLIIERSVSDTLRRARDQQRHDRGQMAPSAALREEPGSGSLARGRPQLIHHLHSQRKRLSLLDSCSAGGKPDGHIPYILLTFG